jgi:DNA primase
VSDFVNGYDSEFLEKLKEKSDIVEVVSSYVELKRKGRNYWACCPFHHEKTPSFAVNDSDQIFHCFGCNVGGDVITFIEMIESVDFVDAVKILADRVKMPLPEFKGDKELLEKKKKRDKLYSVLNEAKLYYIDNLIKNRPQNAVDYIRKRKLSQGSVRKFEIGFSSDSYSIINALLKKGFTRQELLDSGVAQIGKDNNSIYDTMSGRLVFPIIDKFDRCLGFSGRDITNTSYAKYKNTPETEVFHKSDCLFGINLVKKLKQELGLNYVIVCEGQMDVIAMHNAGFGNTVASLGTAFTDLHAKELSKLTNKVYLCFDGDSAGQHAAIKNCEPLLNINMEVRIVTLPDDLDPDEMLNERGKDALSEYINKAVDATEFKILHLQTVYDISDNIGKSKFLKMHLILSLSYQQIRNKSYI